MPGIVGVITTQLSEQNKNNVNIMIKSLMHETIYNSGNYANEDLGVYLGWVCHKGSSIDCMPIWNEKRDKCVFFYGENFPERESIRKLKNNHNFDSDNVSYLIHLYEEKGDDFFSCLNGFFHGVLVDTVKKNVFLFNDRFAMQRIYYCEIDGTFLYSSEAKSLMQIYPDLREIVPASLGQLFSMGCVMGHETLFKDIYQLPSASIWTFRNGRCEKREHYFNRKEWEKQSLLEKDQFYSRLKETFIKVLPRYFADSSHIGMSLTGGLDTRMIMAHAHIPPYSLPCYTFGSMYRDSFDVQVARKIAALSEQKHYTIRVSHEFLVEFSNLAEKAIWISDGYADAASGAVEIYINQKAREIAPIRMTGCNGSEVLRRLRGLQYKPPNQDLFDMEFTHYIAGASEIFYENLRDHELSIAVFKEAPFYNYNRVSLEQSQLIKRTPFMDNDLLALLYQAPIDAVTNDHMSHQLVRDGNGQLSKIVTNRGAGGYSRQFLSKIKQTYYRMLFYTEIGYDYSMPHWVSKIDQYLDRCHLEKLFLGRNNFYHFRLWFRKQLSQYVKHILLDSRTKNRPFLNKKVLVQMVDGHTKGNHNYVHEINAALSLELLHRLFIDK